MDILVIILQLILSLSILVVTHEGGHFFFAKLFGIKVEKFYLFFDPYFSLFKYQKGETEYGIGWVPLGGYVKIAGMVDESMDTEQLAQPVQEWEFRAKPAWQRLLVMIGGVLVNIVTAPIIFWFMLFTWGETYLPNSQAKYGFDFNEVLIEAGFRNGDILVGVDGVRTEKLKDISEAVIYEDGCTIDVLRNGVEEHITLPSEFFRNILSGNGQGLFRYRTPVVVDSVLPDSPAARGGMAANDSIVAVDSLTAPSYAEFRSYMAANPDKDVTFVVVRGCGQNTGAQNDSAQNDSAQTCCAQTTDTLTIHTDQEGRVGFYNYDTSRWFNTVTQEFGFFEALPAGCAKGWEMLTSYCKQLPMLFTREGATKVGGFGTMAKMFPTTWNWQGFWFNTAFLAIILAVMNILPIPALDGGHVLFLFIELISGRKPSDKVLEVAQTIGMVLLLALVLYANGADIVRAIMGCVSIFGLI